VQQLPLGYEGLCAEIVAQTDLLRSHIKGADMTVRVPSCADWNVGQLVRHLGGAHRSAEAGVRNRATPIPDDDSWRDVSGYINEDPAILDTWLAEGALQLAETLRAAGPDAAMPHAPSWATPPTTMFPARRMAHETLIHRADAALALGAIYTVDPDVAIDAIDEWMHLTAMPVMFEIDPERRKLLGPGRTLHFHATDTAPEKAAEWMIDLTGDVITWRRGHEKAPAVAVCGPVTDLLLVCYRRLPGRRNGIEIVGDSQLLDLWLEAVPFG
jgi:uncharacterized protein (TIGR03083 family)